MSLKDTKQMLAVMKIAETGMDSLGSTNNQDEESAFIRGAILGTSLMPLVSNTTELIKLIRMCQQVKAAIDLRRSQGEDIPEGFLSGITEEEVRAARKNFETLSSELEEGIFSEEVERETMSIILDMVDATLALRRLA